MVLKTQKDLPVQSEDEIIQQLQENLKGCKFIDDLLGKDGAIKKFIQKTDNPDGTLRWVFTAGSWVVSSPASGTERTVYSGG
jgi:hypothetical protein